MRRYLVKSATTLSIIALRIARGPNAKTQATDVNLVILVCVDLKGGSEEDEGKDEENAETDERDGKTLHKTDPDLCTKKARKLCDEDLGRFIAGNRFVWRSR